MYTVGSTCANGAAAAASRGMCRTAIPNRISQYLQAQQMVHNDAPQHLPQLYWIFKEWSREEHC